MTPQESHKRTQMRTTGTRSARIRSAFIIPPLERSWAKCDLHEKSCKLKITANQEEHKGPCHICLKKSKHLDDPQVFWDIDLWADEAKVELFGRNGSRSIWRKANTAFHNKNIQP